MEYQMDSNMDRISTETNESGVKLYTYCTSDSVRIGFEGNGADSAVWVPREQVMEFIAALSRVIYSRPTQAEAIEPPEPARADDPTWIEMTQQKNPALTCFRIINQNDKYFRLIHIPSGDYVQRYGSDFLTRHDATLCRNRIIEAAPEWDWTDAGLFQEMPTDVFDSVWSALYEAHGMGLCRRCGWKICQCPVAK